MSAMSVESRLGQRVLDAYMQATRLAAGADMQATRCKLQSAETHNAPAFWLDVNIVEAWPCGQAGHCHHVAHQGV
jgi:hypothetical protein